MINFRKGTFETNSSSTHSICISLEDEDIQIPKKIEIDLDNEDYQFGWEYTEWNTPEEKLAYLIMGILHRSWYYTSFTEAAAQIDKILHKLSDMGIEEVKIRGITFVEYDKRVYIDHEYGAYVDHGTELGELIEEVLRQGDILKYYLFSDKSFILGGNDNDDRGFQEIKVDYPHMKIYKGN